MILEWARRADEGPFSSLGVIDRIVYPCYEPMVTLAAVASITQRARLITTLVLATLRNAGVLAKQAATIDAISGGRLTLGLGVGRREDDFQAAPAAFRGRGKRFEEQLALMKKAWSGEPLGDGVGPIGPPPSRKGGPELLIGGREPVALRRVGRWADGFLAAPAPPAAVRDFYGIATESWKAEGRVGVPRLVGIAYFALGPGGGDRAADYIRNYYTFIGPAVDSLARSALSSAEGLRDALKAYEDIGMDELVLLPCVAELDQVDRLADLVA